MNSRFSGVKRFHWLRSRLGHRPAAIALIFFLLPSIATGQWIGYSGDGQDVTEILWTPGGDTVTETERWSFSSIGQIEAIEQAPDGTIYIGTWAIIANHRLFTVDLEAGTTTQVEALGFLGRIDLAVDDQGVIWVSSTSGQLFTFDPATSEYTLVTTVQHPQSTRGIAWHEGRLFVLLEPISPSDDGPIVGIVDTATGDLSETVVLEDLIVADGFFREFESLDFDDRGGMWIGFLDSLGIIDPPLTLGGVAYLADIESSLVPEIQFLDDNFRFDMPLVIVDQPVVAVPTASELGLLALVMLLAGSAMLHLKRG